MTAPIEIHLVNELNIPDLDWGATVRAQAHHVPLVAAAWNPSQVFNVTGSKVAVPGAWNIYATERDPHNHNPRPAGYHTVENGVPVAYCSLFHSGNRVEGHDIEPLLNNKTHAQIHGQILTGGLAVTLAHEISEMIQDPFVKRYSDDPAVGGTRDGNGFAWLMEICDPVAKSLYAWKDPVTGIEVVLPDFVLPPFYGVKPKPGVPVKYSQLGAATSAFVKMIGGYAYRRDDKTGANVAVL